MNSLVILDVSGIQDFIFGSNQLAQNIGASELVERVTTEWIAETLTGFALTHNYSWTPEDGSVYSKQCIEKDSLDVEVIYAGGGNAVLLFSDSEKVEPFVKAISRRVLREGRGLQLETAFESFAWKSSNVTDSVASVLKRTREKMFKRARSRVRSTPVMGLGVTAECAYTGLPAVGYNTDVALVGKDTAERLEKLGEETFISAEVACKLKMETPGKERLHAVLPQVRANNFEFVYDFDEFGSQGESSYIAVIHTDGNGMGKRFEKLAKDFGRPELNRDYIKNLRGLSSAVARRAKDALQKTVDELIATLNDSDMMRREKIALKTIHHNGVQIRRLPFRPIIFGGDDVTFVCDGRFGLSLAARYLHHYTSGNIQEKPVYARAGVAIVKTHFPFSRAYALAEDLCSSAKKSISSFTHGSESSATVLDWHFSTTGVVRSLADIRARDYTSKENRSLLMRPIRLNTMKGNQQWRTWQTFTELVSGFKMEPWAEKRNKIKALQSALQQTEGAVGVFLHNYRAQLPEFAPDPGMKQTGWHNDQTAYYDAIEALDFFIPLKEGAQ